MSALLAVRRIAFVATPALTPARCPAKAGRGRILRRVLSQRQPSVPRQLSPANHPPAATGYSPSAKRMNMNSRGCQPTESHQKVHSTLKGSHYQLPQRAFRIRQAHHQSPTPRFGPFRADDYWRRVPWVAPTAIHVVRLRRTGESNLCGNYSSSEPPHHAYIHPNP
jgi:hypothetical protein